MNSKELTAALEPIVDELIGLEGKVNRLSDKNIPEMMVRRLEGNRAILKSYAADFVHRAPRQTSAKTLPAYLKSVVES